MSGLLFFTLVFLALAAFGALAVAFGVDTRPGFEDDRAPMGGLTV
jgi:hypothetical protein